MSFTAVPQRTTRLARSVLAVPGSNTRFIEKAPKSHADQIFFDLEDAVAPDQKERARSLVIEALNDLDFAGKSVSVRINGLDTPYMYRDVVDVVEQAGAKLDLILIPKVGTAADIYAVDMLLTQIETAKKINKRIGIELLVETPVGLRNIDAIAAASPRNEAILFGSGAAGEPTAQDWADLLGTIHYEVVTSPRGRVLRAYRGGDANGR